MRQFGFKVSSDADLDELAALAQAEGLPYRWEEEKDRPRMLRMQDPWGFPLAFYFQSQNIPGCCSASICIAARAFSAWIT